MLITTRKTTGDHKPNVYRREYLKCHTDDGIVSVLLLQRVWNSIFIDNAACQEG
jgi:hypothetical protein